MVYTCSRWCDTSSSSFIPIGTLWPTSQPQIGQCHLSAYIALKLYRGLRFGTHFQIVSILTPTDFFHAWAIFGHLVDKNTRKGGVGRAPSQRHMRFEFHKNQVSASEEFSDFFLNVLPYQLAKESWFIHRVGCTTYWVHVSLDWDRCDLLNVISLGTVN